MSTYSDPGLLAMDVDVFKEGVSHEYDGDGGITIVITPFVGYDSISDCVLVGVITEVGEEWSMHGASSDPVGALAKFQLLNQSTFSFLNDAELGVPLGGGIEIRGTIGSVVNQLVQLYGAPTPSAEVLQEMYDKLPSDRHRLALLQGSAGTNVDNAPGMAGYKHPSSS